MSNDSIKLYHYKKHYKKYDIRSTLNDEKNMCYLDYYENDDTTDKRYRLTIVYPNSEYNYDKKTGYIGGRLKYLLCNPITRLISYILDEPIYEMSKLITEEAMYKHVMLPNVEVYKAILKNYGFRYKDFGHTKDISTLIGDNNLYRSKGEYIILLTFKNTCTMYGIKDRFIYQETERIRDYSDDTPSFLYSYITLSDFHTYLFYRSAEYYA
ncbi:MAG: hypothetical protein IKR19_07650 [Acholeplasmatales bacterium]|nr:hypothetical protein [Acholeplasmatales bacterium]